MAPSFLEFRILRDIERNPKISQREIAEKNGISLGKTNYVIRALLEKGHIKIKNFSKSDHKRKYLYILTPHGISEKTRLTTAFLKRKMEEYNHLKQEIEEIRKEIQG